MKNSFRELPQIFQGKWKRQGSLTAKALLLTTFCPHSSFKNTTLSVSYPTAQSQFISKEVRNQGYDGTLLRRKKLVITSNYI